jgi:ATP/maltotriose-dependent transcriptional regulator MalT
MERWLDLPNKERRYAEVKAYPIFDEDGSVKHIFEILLIITDKKKEDRRRRQYIESLEETLKQLNATGSAGSHVADNNQQITLTRRETEVLKLIARGFSNQQIADILRISLDTVKTHLKNLFAKLTVSDRTQAAVWAATHDVK